MLDRDIHPDEIVDEAFIWRYGLVEEVVFALTTITCGLSILIILRASTSSKSFLIIFGLIRLEF